MGRPVLSDELLAEVAVIYRRGQLDNRGAVAVAEWFACSHSGAKKRIAQARARGFLLPIDRRGKRDLHITIPYETGEQLDRFCERWGRSLSCVAGAALRAYTRPATDEELEAMAGELGIDLTAAQMREHL